MSGAGPIDAYFRVLEPVVPLIATAFGHNCEVVLHDFRQPEHSIIAISGNVTERHVGGSMSQIGLAVLAARDNAEEQYNYITRAPNGRILKSSTLPLRAPSGEVFGALCINVDVTDLRQAIETLGELAGPTPEAPAAVTFTDDIGSVIGEVIQEEGMRFGRPLDRLVKADRIEIIKALQRRGVLSLRRAAPQVADHLGLSRATFYAYLREIKDGDGAQPAAGEEGDADEQ